MTTVLRLSLRSCLNSPVLSSAIILTAALGIGAASMVYCVLYAALLRPYPYKEPDRIVRVQTRHIKDGGALLHCSLLDIDDYRRQSTTLENIGVFYEAEDRLLGDGPTQVAVQAWVNATTLDL